MQVAIAFHRAGRLAEAEALYRQVLRDFPEEPEALHLLGLVADATGRKPEAAALLGRAIARRPSADYLNSLGLVREGLTELAAAEEAYRGAIELDPRHVKAWNNLGGVLQALGRLDEAEQAYRQAITLAPGLPSARNNLGTILQAQKKLVEARHSYEQALELRPDYPEALANLASALNAAGHFGLALAPCQRALALRPDYGRALLQLGVARTGLGETSDALEVLKAASDSLRRSPEGPYQLGRALSLLSRLDEAQAAWEESIRRDPGFVPGLEALAGLLVEKIELDAAEGRYRQALALRPAAAVRIKRALVMPAVNDSIEQIDARRAALDQALDELLSEPLRVDEPLSAASSAGFFLAYHGKDDRRLQEKIARVYAHACPSLAYDAPHCAEAPREGRLRIGFISRFMYRHSIGRTTGGLVAGLDRRECEVEVFFAPPLIDDQISRFIKAHSDHWLVLSADLSRAREEIAARECDVLFYQDIGMDPFTYFLAFSRLAPVQCVSFGHPNTSGIPNIDYFVSSSLFEPAGGAQHYSERLHQLADLGTLAYYYRPKLQQPAKTRREFGLSENRHAYLCPQSLFKIHPDIDALFAAILREDPLGQVYLVEGRVKQRVAKLQARFARTIPDVAARVVFLPGTTDTDFLNLVAVCDVMLDTLHFNGMNTSLEAFAMGVPVVTWPGEFQRGRHTAGMYRRMGLGEYIAERFDDYVRLALRLGCDRDYRAEARARILNRADALFEDTRVLREFEGFFRATHTQALKQR